MEWTIIDKNIINKKVLCKCVCGIERMVDYYNILKNKTNSCGCCKKKPKLCLDNFKDIKIGDVFNKLTVIEEVFYKYIKNGKDKMANVPHLKCKCVCNEIVEKRLKDVKKGSVKSCGCTHLGKRYIGNMPRYFYRYLIVQAKQRNIFFDIEFKELSDLIEKQEYKCALSGVVLNFNTSSKILNGNASLDRIDSNKPYILENVQWVDIKINYAKMRLSNIEFIEMCKKVYVNNIAKI